MVFQVKRPNRRAVLCVRDTLGVRETKGDVGIEVEVEGNKFPKHEYEGYDEVDAHLIPSEWSYHKDGSLRGQDNAEYVFKKPLDFKKVGVAVNKLWGMFDDYGTVLEDSNRTSVHVHLNVQEWHLNRLCSFMAMYFSLEEILTAYCGDHRVGNLFCLRAKDAPAIITELKKFFQGYGKHRFSNGMHYAGLNASALTKFGSVEIRTLRGATAPTDITEWVSILEHLYTLSEAYSDPRRVVEGFSTEGPMAYVEKLLGPHTQTVLNKSGMTTAEVIDSLYDGIRYAQDLCYSVEWSELEYVSGKDPFGRPTKQSTLEMQSFLEDLAAPQAPITPSHINALHLSPIYSEDIPEEEDIDFDFEDTTEEDEE